MSDLIAMLKRHEGVRLTPYIDTVGKVTIGCGRNLTDRGLTKDEVELLLYNDVRRCRQEAVTTWEWFIEIDNVRQDVLLNMLFNLGLTRLLGFKKFLMACTVQDWKTASTEMLDSLWATQVGDRATELSQMLLAGEYVQG